MGKVSTTEENPAPSLADFIYVYAPGQATDKKYHNTPAQLKTLIVPALKRNFGITVENPAVGYAGSFQVPVDCTIETWAIITSDGVACSCVVDVRKTDFATLNPPNTLGSSIAGTEKPSLTNELKAMDSNLTTWTTSLLAGEWISFYIESFSGNSSLLTIFLKVTQ